MKKLAILGASYLQRPLIQKAKDMNIETHVFAWEQGAIAKDIADKFYPISILDKEDILAECINIGIDGITTIGTDIAMPSVNYVADKMNLIGNPIESIIISTDKFEMRKALSQYGIPCPKFMFYEKPNFVNTEGLTFPLIIKPTDRSGARGVTKVNSEHEVNEAIIKALDVSINKRVIVEEFIDSDREFSVECISYNGQHYPLVVTDKVTTREPFFVEIAHHQPACISDKVRNDIFDLTKDVLTALNIKNGASHTEMYLMNNGELRVIESAGRMGGDFIGSHMVELSTGFDFLRATIDISLGSFDYCNYISSPINPYSGVYYIIPKPGKIISLKDNSCNFKDIIYSEFLMNLGDQISEVIDGSDKRAAIIVYSSELRNPIKDPNEVLKIETI